MGQVVRAVAQLAQQARCPHGRKRVVFWASRHTVHVSVGFGAGVSATQGQYKLVKMFICPYLLQRFAHYKHTQTGI